MFVLHDYTLEYEVPCDPSVESCFIYECSEEDGQECENWIYKIVRKHAGDVYASCGSGVIDCEAAHICQLKDRLCEITFCDQETDACAVYEPEVTLELEPESGTASETQEETPIFE